MSENVRTRHDSFLRIDSFTPHFHQFRENQTECPDIRPNRHAGSIRKKMSRGGSRICGFAQQFRELSLEPGGRREVPGGLLEVICEQNGHNFRDGQ